MDMEELIKVINETTQKLIEDLNERLMSLCRCNCESTYKGQDEKYKDHTDHVLDEIISEIEAIHEGYPFTPYIDLGVKMSDVKKIINKHKSESVE